MSGIACIFHTDGRPADAAAVRAMTGAMDFRGPDGIAHWHAGSVALGHCQMHTTAESMSERQPLANGNGSCVLVMDGYLSNPDELRVELRQHGAKLRDQSDAELVLRAFEQWGEDCPRHIDGEYAFIVWDGANSSVFCARDHHGLRPLFWHWDGRTLIAASDIAAVLAALVRDPPLNLGYLAEFAAEVAYSPDETIWQGVKRLLAAHALRFDHTGPRLARYWSLPTKPDIFYRSDEEYFEHYREVLSQCVSSASRSHQPVGCEVSGGLDSSAIYGVAHQQLTVGRLPAPAVRGYTLAAPPGTDADEIKYARLVGTHTGTTIAEVPLFTPSLEWFARRAIEDRDLPPFPNAAMSITLDDAAVADGCRVILTGIGGDQWLYGSQNYYRELIAPLRWGPLLANLKADFAAQGLVATGMQFMRLGIGQLLPPATRAAMRRLIGSDVAPSETVSGRSDAGLQLELATRKKAFLAQFAAEYWDSYKLHRLLRPRLLLTLDMVTHQLARSRLDMRSPMLSRRFIEFSARTPEHVRLRGGVGKFIHRRALSGILPGSILNRQDKAEFSLTYTHLIDAMFQYCTSAAETGQIALLNADNIGRIFGAYYNGSVDTRHTGGLWAAYATSLVESQFPKSR